MMKVKDVMKSPVITVSPEAQLGEVARLLQEKGISGAPVVDSHGKLVGIVSEGDLLRRSQQLRVAVMKDRFGWVSPHTTIEEMASFTRGLCTVAETPVSDVMTRRVLTVKEDDSLESVARLMTSRKVNRVPVMQGDQLVGIVSRNDLVWAMVNLCELKPGILE